MTIFAEIIDQTGGDDLSFELADNATVDDLIKAICAEAGFDYGTFNDNYVISDGEIDVGTDRSLSLLEADFGGEELFIELYSAEDFWR